MVHQLKIIACADVIVIHSVACEGGDAPVHKAKSGSGDLGDHIEIGRIDIIILLSVLAVRKALAEIKKVFHLLGLSRLTVGNGAAIIKYDVVFILALDDTVHIYIQSVLLVNLGLYDIFSVFHDLGSLNIEDIIEYGCAEEIVIEIICRRIYQFIGACGVICRFRILRSQLDEKLALVCHVAENIKIIDRCDICPEIIAYGTAYKHRRFAFEYSDRGTQCINNILSALNHAVIRITGGNDISHDHLI